MWILNVCVSILSSFCHWQMKPAVQQKDLGDLYSDKDVVEKAVDRSSDTNHDFRHVCLVTLLSLSFSLWI